MCERALLAIGLTDNSNQVGLREQGSLPRKIASW